MNQHDNVFKNLIELYRARHEPEAMRALATIIWRTILTLFTGGIVAAAFYAVVVFNTVVEQLSATPTSAKYPSTLQRGALEEVIKKIRERSNAVNAPQSSSAR